MGCGLVGTDLPTQRRWRPLRVDGTARRVAVRAEDDERAVLEHVLDVGASLALSRHLDRALFAVEGAAVGASVRPPALRTRVWIVWVWSSHRATRQASWMASRASGS